MDQTLLINAVNVYNLREIDTPSLTIAHNIMLTHERLLKERCTLRPEEAMKTS